MSKITKAAVQVDRYRSPALFYRSAREGLSDLLNAALRPGEGILLPAFIGWSPREGSGVFDPVASSGARYDFYELNIDLTVNLPKLEKALASGRWGMIVLIHYWGRTDPQTEQVRALADRYGALLVEDLAHGFFTAMRGGLAGRRGSVNLYSLHKMFPVSEGGMLQYSSPELVTTQRETMPELARLPIEYDWSAIGEARRSNFTRIADQLRRLPECRVDFDFIWPELADCDVPQSLPVLIHRGNRDEIYERMNADGFGMTSIYHTLLDELQDRFPAMTSVSRSITNFPVHQDVAPDEIEAMIASFAASLRSGATLARQSA